MNDDLSIFITKHTDTPRQVEIFKLNYYFIKKHYPENNIFIIEDNSRINNIELPQDDKIKIITNKLEGHGEVLPFYYFINLKPSKYMLYIHDSCILNKKLNVSDCKPMTYTFYHSADNNKLIYSLLNKCVKDKKLLKKLKTTHYYVCPGVMGMYSLKFCEQYKNILTSLANNIKTRIERECMERIIGMLIVDYNKTHLPDSYFGDLSKFMEKYPGSFYNSPNYTYFKLMILNKTPFDMFKVHFGR